MSERRAFQISDDAADWLLSAVGNDRLWSALAAAPGLQDAVFKGGFQPHPSSLDKPAVRRRLRPLLLSRLDRLEALLRDIPAPPWAAAAAMAAALSEDWLRRHWRGLLRGSADPSWAVALFLDARPALARRGQRLLRCRGLWAPGWPGDPSAWPAPLRRAAPAPAPSAPPPAATAPPAGADSDRAELRAALDRQRERVRAGQHELRQAQQAWELRERDLRRELREARASAEEAAARAETEIAESIRAFKVEALGLSGELSRLDEAAGDPAVEALLSRAERVLEEQRQHNQAHGTYESLRARIRALEAMSQRLGQCMDESIRVLPEVRRLHAAVCRESERLRALLPEVEPPVTELVAQLLGRVKQAAAAGQVFAELDRIEKLLDTEVLADLLGPQGQEQVRAALSRRRRMVTDAVHEPAVTPPAAAGPRRPREIWDVHEAVAHGATAAVRVFVDGYNVIRRTPDLAALEQQEGLARGREALCQFCRSRARLFAHLEVVFDGQGALSAREACQGVTVVFSRGLQDSENADEYLLTRLARCHDEGVAAWLVTDDGGLRHR
ncbi:MAG: hypothetical protein GX595_01430, partial [Lentisphaerae bacterium]|nr:hypothetical protein [Lentisphaerota bacterium]